MTTTFVPVPVRTKSKLFFLTNEEPELAEKTKNQISQRVEEEFENLIYKRKKQEEKKEKLKKINQQYEHKRADRLKKLNDKIFQSEEIKAKNVQVLQEKIKLKNDRYKEIRNKIYHRTLDNIEKSMTDRRIYEHDSYLQKKKSQNTATLSRLNNSASNAKLNKIIMLEELRSEKNKKQINLKLERATSKIQANKRKLVERKKQEEKQLEEIQRKVREKMNREEQKKLKELYERSKTLENCRTNANEIIKKQSEQKKKMVEDKLKKWEQNIYRVGEEKDRKLNILNDKLMKTNLIEKKWKNEKQDIYMDLFSKNAMELEARKHQKAQKIMNKHTEISLKNKYYKEKKNQMLKAVKTIDISY